jgi:signal transduction histidine kinase
VPKDANLKINGGGKVPARAKIDLKTFFRDKTLSVAFNLAGLAAVSLFTGFTAGPPEGGTVAGTWLFALIAYLAVDFALLHRRAAAIGRTVEGTSDKFLLSVTAPEPRRSEDRLYYELMLIAGKSAVERVTAAENEKSEYYDYLTVWAHEIKTPIAAAELIALNNAGEAFEEIAAQLRRIDGFVEQILFAARAGNAEKDLLIRKTDLKSVVGACLQENKRFFIDAGARIETDADGAVLTDGKWLAFALKQILVNSVKYAKPGGAEIKVTASPLPGGHIRLAVRDHGIGILESELPRIFEKGFTGTNGRRNTKSTGLGLFLVKKLCEAMDIAVSAESKEGEYTEIALVLVKA